MLLGFKREEAAKFSLILAVPTILAAAGLDVLKFWMDSPVAIFESTNLMHLAVGFVAAFLSAFLILQWFISYLRRNSLQDFGIYRLIVTGILVIMGFWR
jgi:undecaprenyl-diphosphatase